jgi:glycerone phosphate O-acyltransferase
MKHLMEKDGCSVILIPSFKSYVDSILLSYINIINEIDLPFEVGNSKFSNIPWITNILKRCGAFFIDEKPANMQLFRVLLEEYFSQILASKYLINYHLENRRERSGKVAKPQGFVFEHILEAYFRNHD